MNRVHHVSWCLEPENMDAAKEMWEQQLGIELIDFVLEADGLRVLLAWDPGVELISPHDPLGPAGTMVRAHLDKQGEGVYATVLLTDDFGSVQTGMKAVGSRLVHPEEAVIEGVPLPNGVIADDINSVDGNPGFKLSGGLFEEVHGMRLAFQQFRALGR
jgi:methylmalonyl-CoA/ethylmalonyl-CoA epimerase